MRDIFRTLLFCCTSRQRDPSNRANLAGLPSSTHPRQTRIGDSSKRSSGFSHHSRTTYQTVNRSISPTSAVAEKDNPFSKATTYSSRELLFPEVSQPLPRASSAPFPKNADREKFPKDDPIAREDKSKTAPPSPSLRSSPEGLKARRVPGEEKFASAISLTSSENQLSHPASFILENNQTREEQRVLEERMSPPTTPQLHLIESQLNIVSSVSSEGSAPHSASHFPPHKGGSDQSWVQIIRRHEPLGTETSSSIDSHSPSPSVWGAIIDSLPESPLIVEEGGISRPKPKT